MFTVTVGFQEMGEFNTFKEAFKVFWEKVKEQIQKGTSLMALEQTNYIEYTTQEGHKCIMSVYQVLSFAAKVGLLTEDDKLNETVEEPSELAVGAAFRQVQLDHFVDSIIVASEIVNRFKGIVAQRISSTSRSRGEY